MVKSIRGATVPQSVNRLSDAKVNNIQENDSFIGGKMSKTPCEVKRNSMFNLATPKTGDYNILIKSAVFGSNNFNDP